MIEANNYGLTIREQGGSGLVFDLGLANSHIPAAARKILVRYIDAACLACIAVFRSECAKQFESAHMSSQTSVGFDRIIAIDAQAILREAGAK
jgi:hypothetical protein